MCVYVCAYVYVYVPVYMQMYADMCVFMPSYRRREERPGKTPLSAVNHADGPLPA